MPFEFWRCQNVALLPSVRGKVQHFLINQGVSCIHYQQGLGRVQIAIYPGVFLKPLFFWSDGWEKCWDKGLTPWDLGRPTPVVLQLVQSGTLPKGRVLVPGCGMVRLCKFASSFLSLLFIFLSHCDFCSFLWNNQFHLMAIFWLN